MMVLTNIISKTGKYGDYLQIALSDVVIKISLSTE
jgi:hypothetical protein